MPLLRSGRKIGGQRKGEASSESGAHHTSEPSAKLHVPAFPVRGYPMKVFRDDGQRGHASTSMMRPPLREVSMHHREYPRRPAAQDASMRANLREATMRQNYDSDASNYIRQPFVKLADICRSHDDSRRRDDGFLRPQTPPGVKYLEEMEKSNLEESIYALIRSPHLTALEVVHTLNTIENSLVVKIDKFCRKQEKAQSILRNTLSETVHDAGMDRGRDVETWLAGVGPQANQSKRRPDYFGNDSVYEPKGPKLQNLYNHSRYNY